MSRLVMYNGQKYEIGLSYARFVLADDFVENVSVAVVPDDGGLVVSAAQVTSTRVLLKYEAAAENKKYRTELYVETESARASLRCQEVSLVPQPKPAAISLFLKPTEQQAYQLQYGHRLSSGETLADVVATTPVSDIFVFAQVESEDTVLLVVGAAYEADIGSQVDIPVAATTSNGRTFPDTVRLFVGACNGQTPIQQQRIWNFS